MWQFFKSEIVEICDDPIHLNYKYSVWNIFMDTKKCLSNEDLS